MTEIRPNASRRGDGTTSWSGSITEAGSEMRSYYGRPILKEPVWKPEIPFYFFTGGLAGASAVLGLGARLAGNVPLAKAATYVSAGADVVSPALLVSDLGRPERFLNMLRVFKVTSPMSVGSWILALSGALSTATAACEALGILPRVKLLAELGSAAAGAPLSVYTATLVSDTAIPVWHEAREELPFVFGTSALASAGAAASILVAPEHAGPARRLAIGAALAENALMHTMEKKLGMLGEPYKKGVSGALAKVAKGTTLAGAGILALGGRRSRIAAATGGALVLAGEVALRWSVFKAGFESARDPRYVVESQRARLEARAR